MAGSVNRVILLGNLGKDPEIRTAQSGDRIANLSLATSETWTDKQSGERKERTEWHRVVCFNDRLSEVIQKYVKKGSKVYVEGQLQTRKWTDQSGQDRFSTEVVLTKFRSELVLLSSANGSGDRPAERTEQRQAPAGRSGQAYGGAGSDLDDEIPF